MNTMATINVMTSDITGRLFETARIIGLNDEHRNLLTEAGNTISSLRERCEGAERNAEKVSELRSALENQKQEFYKLERALTKQKNLCEELEADKVTFRKLAEYMVDNQ